MELLMAPERVKGLGEYEVGKLKELLEVLRYHETKNRDKNRYYEGKVTLAEVNLGIALPQGMGGLEIGCAWEPRRSTCLRAARCLTGLSA